MVERIYAATAAGRGWPHVLREVGRPLGCRIALLEDIELGSNGQRTLDSFGISSRVRREYLRQWAGRDPFMARAVSDLPRGWVERSSRFVPDPELVASPYYSEFLWPLGVRYLAGACIDRERGRVAMLSLLREESRGSFTDAELGVGRILLPHLRQTLAIRRRLVQAAERERALSQLMDGFASGVVVFDRGGRVVLANRAAQLIIHRRDGLEMRGEELVANDRLETEVLVAAVERVCSGSTRGSREGLLRISVSRPGGGRYSLSLSPFLGAERNGDGPAALALIADPDSSLAAASELLHRFFGLTAAESRVACALADEPSPRAVGRRLGITYQTVRTHLRRVFAKTGARSQAEVVRMVLALPVEATPRWAIPGPVEAEPGTEPRRSRPD